MTDMTFAAKTKVMSVVKHSPILVCTKIFRTFTSRWPSAGFSLEDLSDVEYNILCCAESKGRRRKRKEDL